MQEKQENRKQGVGLEISSKTPSIAIHAPSSLTGSKVTEALGQLFSTYRW